MARSLLFLAIICLVSGCDPRISTLSEVDSPKTNLPEIDSSKTNLSVVDSSKILPHEDVNADFGTGDWRLFFGTSGEIGLPLEAFLHLYAQKGNRIENISSPEEMKKLDGLSVMSNNAALSFVRLFTDRRSFIMFLSPAAIEYEPETTVVEKKADGFYVTRKLVYAEETKPGEHDLYRIKERVSFAGQYQIVEKRFLRYLSRTDAGIPMFE